MRLIRAEWHAGSAVARKGGTVETCSRTVLGHRKDNMPATTKPPTPIAVRCNDDEPLSWMRRIEIHTADLTLSANLCWDDTFGYEIIPLDIWLEHEHCDVTFRDEPFGDKRDGLLTYVRKLTQNDLRDLAVGTRGWDDLPLPDGPI